MADILSHGWDSYAGTHPVPDDARREAEKAIRCRTGEKGVFVYWCEQCERHVYQLLGCNSRLCSRCGKRYTDQWSASLSKSLFDVPHRHFVLSIPSQLWPCLKEDKSLWKTYMDSAAEACADYFPKLMRDPSVEIGMVVILHPFGKDMRFQPHLHLIATEGGIDGHGNFVGKDFIPARQFARCWQYHISKNLQAAGLPNSLFTELYKDYDGFYVWVHRSGRIEDPRDIARYVGRYVRHPAIADSRITSFDGGTVTFFYEEEDSDGNKSREYVSMDADEFISSLIQHIPPKQFKMIRHYGAYARNSKRFFKSASAQSGIASCFQDTLYMPGWKFKPSCPYCGGILKFERFMTIPPPGDCLHWDVKREDLVRWKNLSG